MDVFITNVPPLANHQQIRLFLKTHLRNSCDTLAFDIFKKGRTNWAILTIPDESRARVFLSIFGSTDRRQRPLNTLIFQGNQLGFRKSNKIGQPDPTKLQALRSDEQRIRKQTPSQSAAKRSLSVIPFTSLSLGVSTYHPLRGLTFDAKHTDARDGTIIFGDFACVIYLKAGVAAGEDWHCRIDIPYSTIEHSTFSADVETSVLFALQTPPKFYKIVSTDDLHLYSGQTDSPATDPYYALSVRLESMNLSPDRDVKRLSRLCTLKQDYSLVPSLCMVYKIALPSLDAGERVWQFVRAASTMPDRDCFRALVPTSLTDNIDLSFARLNTYLAQRSYGTKSYLSFDAHFQILALAYEGTITPNQMLQLLPRINAIARSHDSGPTAAGIRRLGFVLPTPSPRVHKDALSNAAIESLLVENIEIAEQITSTSNDLASNQAKHSHLALTYKATVTPTGLLLRGPDPIVSNRILRKYIDHSNCFMRVFFADEDGLSVFQDSRADQSEVYRRFRKVMIDGIAIADRLYTFLGWSHSSLRDHTAWFMAPFIHEGRLIMAKEVIRNIGDFSHMQCPAKCAARIGQAFSDTIYTMLVPQSATVTEALLDVERNGRVFSDGCGKISMGLLQKVWRALPDNRRKQEPTIMQIRYRGCKGVVSLDSTLTGDQLHIRKSMAKFVATEEWRDLEICGAAYKPLTMFLNHQFVKILEDLGIPETSFTSVLNEAMKMLEMIIKHPINAANFLEYNRCGTSAKIPMLFTLLSDIGLEFQADKFLTDFVEVAAIQSVRDMKYRARIPIENGMALYGIMDETNTLGEGEVYIVTQTMEQEDHPVRKTFVQERVVVTRAPALHPGDVQVVRAVDVPSNSPLQSLHNCIVFSQQGKRDLASQLSGGDLDGDLFHIILDKRLIPSGTTNAADYHPAASVDLGRPVEREDIIDFFIEYMHSDCLGRVSNLHKVQADIQPTGTFHGDCLTLAKMASDAVDFSKSGMPVNMRLAPKVPSVRPDFMGGGPNLVYNDKGPALEDAEEVGIDEPDSISILDPDRTRYRYYKSQKVLGVLYRAIDERRFLDTMHKEFEVTRMSLGNETLMGKLKKYVTRETRGLQWEQHRHFAEDVREYYEMNMVEIMESLRLYRGQPLTELEVFSGNILGKKERASTRALREANMEVRERFNRDVSSVINRIVSGNGEDDDQDIDEALPRALACFYISLEEQGWENYVRLKSFRYVAAAVCLERLWIYMGLSLRRF